MRAPGDQRNRPREPPGGRAGRGGEARSVAGDPTRFLAVETWASLEHDAAYREWRTGEGAAGLAELRQHYSAPPKLTVATPREDI